MWIYLISIIISSTLVSIVLPVLIPKFKQKEERENAFAKVNKVVFPDKMTKGFFVFLTIFLLLVDLVLILVPQVCEVMGFNWLTTNIVCWSISLLDLVFLLYFLQVSRVEYNEDYMLIINIFHRANKINYSDIVKVSSNIKIFTKKEKYFIPCASFYGGKEFKSFILKKVRSVR